MVNVSITFLYNYFVHYSRNNRNFLCYSGQTHKKNFLKEGHSIKVDLRKKKSKIKFLFRIFFSMNVNYIVWNWFIAKIILILLKIFEAIQNGSKF